MHRGGGGFTRASTGMSSKLLLFSMQCHHWYDYYYYYYYYALVLYAVCPVLGSSNCCLQCQGGSMMHGYNGLTSLSRVCNSPGNPLCVDYCPDLEICTYSSSGYWVNPESCFDGVIPCREGTYSSGYYGATACNTCPVGSKCVYKSGYAACPAGTYQPYTGRTMCYDCPAGTYQESESGVTCYWCDTCSAGKYTDSNSMCATNKNQRCIDCPPGTYSTTTNAAGCTSCPAGQYQNLAGQTGCKTQAVCTAGSYTEVVGSSTVEQKCKACVSPWTTILGSETSCPYCVKGKYRSNNMCVDCSCTGGTAERYMGCTVGSTTQTCPYCTGTQPGGYCEVGKEPNLVCTGAQDTDTVCTECNAGYHKPIQNQRSCEKCGTGYYKTIKSVNSCTACANKNPTNPAVATYDAWGVAAATTNACPW